MRAINHYKRDIIYLLTIILKIFHYKTEIIPIGIKKINIKRKNFKKLKFNSYFLFVGNLRAYKGIEYLIDAFEGISEKLVIVGNGRLINKVRRKISKLKNIQLITNINEKNKIQVIKGSKALIMPSVDRR